MRIDEIVVGEDYYLRYQGRVRVLEIVREARNGYGYGGGTGVQIRRAKVDRVREDGSLWGRPFVPTSATRLERTWAEQARLEKAALEARARQAVRDADAGKAVERLQKVMGDSAYSLRQDLGLVLIRLTPEQANALADLLTAKVG